MVVAAIQEQLGVEFDRRRVELNNPIKVAGAHQVTLSIYRDVNAVVTVLVGVNEAEEEVEAEEAETEAAEVETVEDAE